MTDSEPDPVDDLLRRAFAADDRQSPAADVTAQVMARIQRRQRWRRLVLAAGGGIGLALALWFAHPALASLINGLVAQASGAWTDSALVLGALALGIGLWLLVLEEEAG